MSLRVWRFAGAVLLVGGGLACGPAVDLDDASGSGSSDATADGTTGAGTAETSMGPTSAGPTSMGPTSVGPTSDDGSEATDATGSPVACPPVPEHGCDGPIDCRGQQCGRPNSPYDVDGCLRFRCDGPEDCASGEVCHRPLDWGGCVSSGWSCEEDPELGCICGGRADCGGSYCLPADQVPPVHCTELTSAPECLDRAAAPSSPAARSPTPAAARACAICRWSTACSCRRAPCPRRCPRPTSPPSWAR